jgi:hypothetical protein
MTEQEAREIINNSVEFTEINNSDDPEHLEIHSIKIEEGDQFTCFMYLLPDGVTIETATKEQLEDGPWMWVGDRTGAGLLLE